MTNPDVRQTLDRDAFERFHGARKNKGLKKAAQRFERLPDGTYADDSVQRHWWTWQNARAALAEQPASVADSWVDADTGEQRVTPRPARHKRPPPFAAAPKPEDTK